MLETPVNYVVSSPGGGWRLEGSRVSLDSVVHAYLQGLSPEAIADSFPTLSLEQVHGAIAFYLHNRGEIDMYLASQEVRWQTLRDESEVANASLLARIRAARERPNGPEPPQ